MQHEERWERERQFFDDEEYDERPIPPSTIARYITCRKPWLQAEFPFYILGDVRDKYILEIGCGDGGNAILLALRGARVIGIDISPKAVEVARRRAERHGVSSNTLFVAAPLEQFRPPTDEPFDIVCGWAVLHHLLPVLDQTMSALTAMGKPGALFMFVEPVTSRWLRSLRLKLPIPVRGTPDERPLEPEDIAIVQKRLPDLRMRRHNAMIRIARQFFRGRYEDFGPVKRAVYDCIARLDGFCLNQLGLSALAGGAVMYGRTSSVPARTAATSR